MKVMGTLYSICLETMWVLPKPLRIWREFFHAFSPFLGMDFSITGLEDFFNLPHDWGSIYKNGLSHLDQVLRGSSPEIGQPKIV